MEHQDALMSEVTIIVDDDGGKKWDELQRALQAAGLEIGDTDPDEGEIEGVCASFRVPDLKAVPGVRYVRVEMQYVADYPRGDPRDLDKDDEEIT
jgi:hypothetical protein